MEPRIQYAKTSDGVNIAFWKLGEGVPIVLVGNLPWSNMREEWDWPAYRRTYEWALQHGALVRYDHRGCGLSQRNVTALSLSTYILDLEAVSNHLTLARFVLIGTGHGGPVAAAYAADHPDRVSHLVLYPAYLRAADVYATPAGQALRALRDKDWNIYSETMARVLAGFVGGEQEMSRAAAYYRSCVSQEGCLAAHRAIEEFDLTDVLPQIRVPTLVLYRSGGRLPTVELTQAAAAAIPGAELVIFDVDPNAGWFAQESILISQFVGLDDSSPKITEPAHTAFRTVLFTDVVENTALLRRIGDEAWRVVMRQHEEIVRAALKEHEGTEISTSGDGFFASFGSSVRALQCAVEMQREFALRNETAEHPVEVRIGLNAGEPIEEGKEVLGTAVTMAARIMSQAGAGEILVSDVIRQLVAGKGFLFADRGEFVAKGFEEPVRVYAVRWSFDSPSAGAAGGSG